MAENIERVQVAMELDLSPWEKSVSKAIDLAKQLGAKITGATNDAANAAKDATSKAGKEAEKAVQETTNAAKKITDTVEKAAKDTGKNVEKGMEGAKKATEKLADGVDKELKPIDQSAKTTGENLKKEFAKASDSVARETKGMGAKVSRELEPIKRTAKTTNDNVEKEFRRGFKNANKAVQTEMGGMQSTVQSAMGGIAGIVGKAVAAIGITKLGKASLDMAADLEETQNVVDVAFGEMSYKADNFAATAISTYGMSETAAKKVASTHMAMAKGMDLPTEAASNMSIEMSKLAADMASFFNTTTDITDTALRSVWTGETETLKKYGVVMTQANLQAYALKNGITANISEMDQASAAALRYSYVTETLGYVQGDFARNSDSWANQTRILSEQFKQLGTIVGGWLVKALSGALQMLNSVMGKVIQFATTLNSVFKKLFNWQSEAPGGMPDTGSPSAPSAPSGPVANPKAVAAQKKQQESIEKARKKHNERNAKLMETYQKQVKKQEERVANEKKKHEERNKKAVETFEKQKLKQEERIKKATDRRAKAEEKARKEIEETKGELAGFDQLNILNEPSTKDPYEALADMEIPSMDELEPPDIQPFTEAMVSLSELEPPELEPFVADLEDAAGFGNSLEDMLNNFAFPSYDVAIDPVMDDSKFDGIIERFRAAGQSIKDWWTGNFGDIWTDFVDKASTNLENTKAIFRGVWEDLKTLGPPLANWFNNEFTEHLRAQASLTSTIINGVWDSFNQIFSAVWDQVLFPFIQGFVVTWLPLLTNVATAITRILEEIFLVFKQIFDRVALEIVVPLLGFLVAEWNKFGEWLSEQWETNGEAIIAAVMAEIAAFQVFANQVIDDIIALGSPLQAWWDDSFVPLLQTTIASVWAIFWDLYGQVTKVMRDLWDLVLYPFVQTIVNDWLPILTEIIDEAVQTFTTLYTAVSSIFNWIWGDVISPILSLIMNAWTGFSTDMKAVWDKHGRPIFEGIRTAIQGFAETLTQVWNEHIKPVWDKVIAKVKQVWEESIRPFVRDFVDGIGRIIRVLLDFWNNTAKPVIDYLIQRFGPAISAVFEFFGGVVTNAWNVISGVFDGLRKIFNGIVTFIEGVFSGDWSKAWEGVVGIFGGIWGTLKALVGGVWDHIVNLFSGGGKIFRGIAEGIGGVFKKIVNSIIRGINKVVKAPFDFINGILNKIRNFSILGGQPFSGLWSQNPITVPQIPALDVGTNYVQRSGLAVIHEGEAVVPKKYNPALGGGESETQIQLLEEQNTLLRRILDKDTDVYLDDKNMTNRQARNARRHQLATGGA